MIRFNVDRHYEDSLYMVFYLLARVFAITVQVGLSKELYEKIERVMIKIDSGNFT